MKALIYILQMVVLAILLICLCSPAFSAAQIDVGFEVDPAVSQKLVHAQAVFPARQAVVYDVFNRIADYSMLHAWIHKTTLIGTGEGSQVFRVEFRFPWPVGRQWSHVEVRHRGNAIFWRQVAGSLKENHGNIRFTTVNGKVDIDYRAAIDVGLPELWTRSYKEKFVREFLAAAYKQIELLGSPAVLAEAADP